MNGQISPARFSLCSDAGVRAISALEVMVCIVLVLVLIGVALPLYPRSPFPATQTKALAHAKQIGLALKLYAGDHDGRYPVGVNAHGEAIRTSNDAFRDLFPTYVQTETIFTNKLSAWGPAADNIWQPIAQALRPGENAYAYVAGLDGNSDLSAPLVVDGTARSGAGHYVSDPVKRGGAWKGTKAVVIRLDNSGALETLTGPPDARYVPVKGRPSANLLHVSANLGASVKLLNPADPAAVRGAR